MKRLRLVSLLVVFVLVITPLAVMAQDDEIKLEDFVSEDESLTIGYPEGWAIQENDVSVTGTPGVLMANSEDTLATMLGNSTDPNLSEGQEGIAVLLLPVDLLAFMGIQVPTGDEPLDILPVADAFFASTMGTGEDPSVDITKAEELPLSDEITGGYIEVKDPTVEGAMIVFELKPGVLAVVFAGAYPGEYADASNNTLIAVAQSLAYTGTGDDLMALLMGGGSSEGSTGDAEATPSDTGSSSGSTSSTLDGQALVAERCTTCHSAARIDSEHMNEAGWTAVVDRMISYGAQLNADERDAVIAYLTETH
jgi:hypothetical protein